MLRFIYLEGQENFHIRYYDLWHLGLWLYALVIHGKKQERGGLQCDNSLPIPKWLGCCDFYFKCASFASQLSC